MTKTFVARQKDIQRKWWLIDAEDLVLGRLASITANILRGKNKAIFTPNVDCGDNVIIINAEKVKLTGKKRDEKTYYWHTGHPGGIKSRTADKILDGKFPERVITKAVTNMMSKGPLQRDIISKLKVYKGPNHPHEAQNPEKLDIASMNKKNKK